MNKIVALQREHDLTLPDEFHFKYAQVALLAETCAGQSRGSQCWQELSNRPKCYVWNDYLLTGETVTWTVECSGGWARGTGTLTWGTGKDERVNMSGRLQDGKKHGHWVERGGTWSKEGSYDYDNGRWVGGRWSKEGSYVDGKKHGRWVFRDADGNVEKGSYKNGKRHGRWVDRGDLDGKLRWHYEGDYVDGKRHGLWIIKGMGKRKKEINYLNGERVN